MKIDFKPVGQSSAPVNEIGLLAWSLLADTHLNMVGGGIPGQPDPDPAPTQPTEPGVPTLPDDSPPTPVA